MANTNWSLLAGGAALGVVGGFVLALQWNDDVAPAVRPPAAASAAPDPAVVQAIEAQAKRISELEAELERLSATVRDLTRALRELTAARTGAAPAGRVLPWLPPGSLEVAKAWYAERIAGSIQALAARAEAPEATDDAKHGWAVQAKREGEQLQSLRRVTSESQFAAWLQSTGHGERVPSREELAAAARRLSEQHK
ncbi:MAG: hypothetical protein ACYTGX_05480 [Planctomycetota bacterium]|jgi:hypothetical protein